MSEELRSVHDAYPRRDPSDEGTRSGWGSTVDIAHRSAYVTPVRSPPGIDRSPRMANRASISAAL